MGGRVARSDSDERIASEASESAEQGEAHADDAIAEEAQARSERNL